MPDPAPPGLVAPPVLVVAAAGYHGVVRQLVVGLKEHRRFAVARPLGGLLAASVAAALLELDLVVAPVTLVPMPSTRAAVRSRGHDAVAGLARRAAQVLRSHGAD
ncbi:MAG: ComF family protein, partial [Actinomycetota bacterium]|nr:ComF family protein [Actinomycetota bacterium]